MIINIFGTSALVLLMVLSAQPEWPDPREGWARVIGAVIILAAIWL